MFGGTAPTPMPTLTCRSPLPLLFPSLGKSSFLMADDSLALGERRTTPDHPPYGEMISNAITTLKEEGGSTEASIDSFIRSKYKEELLPPAHSNLLRYHLSKLIRLGELEQPTPNTYIVTPDGNPSATLADTPTPEPPVKERKRRGRPPKQRKPEHQQEAAAAEDATEPQCKRR